MFSRAAAVCLARPSATWQASPRPGLSSLRHPHHAAGTRTAHTLWAWPVAGRSIGGGQWAFISQQEPQRARGTLGANHYTASFLPPCHLRPRGIPVAGPHKAMFDWKRLVTLQHSLLLEAKARSKACKWCRVYFCNIPFGSPLISSPVSLKGKVE